MKLDEYPRVTRLTMESADKILTRTLSMTLFTVRGANISCSFYFKIYLPSDRITILAHISNSLSVNKLSGIVSTFNHLHPSYWPAEEL